MDLFIWGGVVVEGIQATFTLPSYFALSYT